MANVKSILEGARVYLGDVDVIRYSETAIRVALGVALTLVNQDLGTDFIYSAGVNDITPVPNNVQRYLISLAIAMVILMGEETASVLSGGGAIWKSGLASISLATSQKSMSDVTTRLLDRYEKAMKLATMPGAEAYDFDLYQITDTDFLEIN